MDSKTRVSEDSTVSFTTETSLDIVWELMTTVPGVGRWLGAEAAPASGIIFASPVSPQLIGVVSAIVQPTDDSPRASIALEVAGRKAGIELTRTADESTVTVSDAGMSVVDGTRDAWESVLAEVRILLQEFRLRTPRQAIVLIHGIGEQRPGATLSSFVQSPLMALDGQGQPRKIFSKPDRLAESMELRRYQMKQSDERPRTDLYEYYWAHEVGGTTLDQVSGWFLGLGRRRPWEVPRRFMVPWFVVWTLIVALAFAALALAVGLWSEVAAYVGWAGAVFGEWREVFLLATLISLLSGAATAFLKTTVGDIPRYVSAKPENISIRQSIRENGLKLLRQLHESGDYDRVIIVGHSLGSIIGYDLIRLYWAEVNARHRSPGEPLDEALEAYEDALGTGAPAGSSAVTPVEQSALWKEQRRNGDPWLITDFITLGSPLAFADLFLASGKDDLREQVDRRELPVCPPVTEGDNIHYTTRYRAGDRVRELKILHHAAPFAVTRWTNIYFESRLLLFGDPVAGPASALFGAGVQERPLAHQRRGWWLHSRYWRGTSPPAREAQRVLREALALDARAELEALADQLPAGERLTQPEAEPV